MNDPRITAYALNELAPAEREAFEKELAESTILSDDLAETVAFCTRLEAASSGLPKLDEDERAALLSSCRRNLASRFRRTSPGPLLAGVATALAACLALALLLPREETGRTKPGGTVAVGDDAVAVPQSSPPALQPAEPAVHPTPSDELIASTIDAAAKGATVATAAARQIAPLAGSAAPAPPTSETTARESGLERSKLVESGFKAFTGGWGKGAGATSDTDGLVDSGAQAAARGGTRFRTEAYAAVEPGGFLSARENPLSTFSVDVDTASYSNVRRILRAGALPPKGAVRVEEFINYFPYNLPEPTDGSPLAVTADAAPAPWNPGHVLVRITLQGRALPESARPQSNLVFLVDVSGSMQAENKLPLLKKSLDALVGALGARDRVAIVTYAGEAGLALAPTADKEAVRTALAGLGAGGSTNGAGGIRRAYEVARENFLSVGNNRVILCTDGDFNVGTTSESELVELIESERASGVFLSILGFGEGNLKDSTMEKLADKGNGNYAYVDSLREARKALVEQMTGTLFAIAKDVKLQVEFNPVTVAGYRLIGYENRILAKEDFNNDARDAGDIGAGHSVTAFYEVVPAGRPIPGSPSVDPLKYSTPHGDSQSLDLLTIKLRYKLPDAAKSALIETSLASDRVRPIEEQAASFRFAAAAAAFAMKLRANPAFEMGWDAILALGRGAIENDPGGHRAEFLTLVEQARQLEPQEQPEPPEPQAKDASDR
jgi:Ca-activated chloride channel family protein